MEPGGALLRRPSARQGDDTEAAAPFRALLFALCLITVFVMLPLVILTDSNGWIARDAEDEREADQKSANAADENWVADSIFIFIYIGIRLCECVPRRIAFRREMARANEHTALINSTALTSVPPINGAARPVPQRVLDRVALERAAMTRATRPQPSSEPSARDLVDDLAVALARPAPVVRGKPNETSLIHPPLPPPTSQRARALVSCEWHCVSRYATQPPSSSPTHASQPKDET